MGMADDGFKERMAMTAKLSGNATELSRKTGISRRAIGTYLSGASDPTRERLVAMADTAGVSVEWLATGRGEIMAQSGETKKMVVFPGLASDSVTGGAREEGVDIPHYTVSASDREKHIITMVEGIGSVTVSPDYFNDVSISNPSNLQMLTLSDDELSPAGLGTVILVDKGQTIKEGNGTGVYLMKINGEMQIRVAQMQQDNQIKVLSFKGEQPSLVIDHDHHALDVIGKVVWTCGHTA